MMVAARFGDANNIEALLEREKNFVDEHGNTAFVHAVKHRQPRAIAQLWSERNVRNKEGRSGLELLQLNPDLEKMVHLEIKKQNSDRTQLISRV